MTKSFVRGTKLTAWFASSLVVLFGEPAVAWDGAVSGTISTIEITDGNIQGLRIMLSGVNTICSGGANWGYLNESDSNYKTYAAALMMAKAQGSVVAVYSNLVSGYCHIGYVSIS